MNLLHSTYTVTKECGISTRQLYYWELIGIIRPHYETFGTRRFRRYTMDDLELLKQVKSLLDEGFTLQAVRERLQKHKVPGSSGTRFLRSQVPSEEKEVA